MTALISALLFRSESKSSSFHASMQNYAKIETFRNFQFHSDDLPIFGECSCQNKPMFDINAHIFNTVAQIQLKHTLDSFFQSFSDHT